MELDSLGSDSLDVSDDVSVLEDFGESEDDDESLGNFWVLFELQHP